MSRGRVRFDHPRKVSRVREFLLSAGIAGVVASAMAFAPPFGGAARSAHSGSPDAAVAESTFAEIYADSEEDDARPQPGFRLASADADITGTIRSAGNVGQTTGSLLAPDHASF